MSDATQTETAEGTEIERNPLGLIYGKQALGAFLDVKPHTVYQLRDRGAPIFLMPGKGYCARREALVAWIESLEAAGAEETAA